MRALGVHRFVAVLAAFVLVLSSSPQAADAVSTCSGTTLVPNLTRFEVNQGLGSYDRLTRGKPALVRAYFSLPDSTTCTLGSGQALNITGATLNVVGGGSSNSGIAAANAAGFATSAALSARPALVDSSHDPFFAVSGSILAPSSSTTPAPSFSATFTVNVTYTRKLSSRDVTTGLTASFNAVKTVDQESKAIRILFQPLGDKSGTTTQFTDADRTSVVNAVQTLLRVLPVPAGPPGSLRPPVGSAVRSGGIRYEIVPSLMDVKSIPGAYKLLVNGTTGFCATQSVFVALAPTLGAALDTFNSVQAPEDAADLIVGVYGEAISGGSADGCALGMASPNAKVSIARAVADKPKVGATPAVVSQTGAVMAQEIMHNLGAQPSPRSTTFHSSYTQADNTDPDGAYNVSSMTYIAGDKTIMNVNTATGPWDNNVTVLEQPDYTFALCRFGGTPPPPISECTTPDPGGTLVGVAASDSYLASGDTTNGVSNAYYGTSAGTTASPNSLYRLLQLKGGVIQGGNPKGTGIPVAPATTHGDGLPQPGIFTFALPRSAVDVDETRIVQLAQLTDDPLLAPIIFRAFKNPSPPNVVSLSNIVPPGGATLNFTRNVTPPKNPDGDIVFLADTTGSMLGAITNVRSKADDIMAAIRTEQPLSQFAVASYKDFNQPDGCDPNSTYQYRLDRAMTSDTTSVRSAMDAWEASGGCDTPEAQLYALYQIATSTSPSTGFRTDPVRPRAIGWFGDAPGHDPSPYPDGITEATAISALQAAGIRVVAVSTTTPGNPGLDAAVSPSPTICDGGCPTAGQATRIANATGGAVKPAGTSTEVADALLAGLLSATVKPVASCDEQLTFAADPSQRVVRSGTGVASFNETVMVNEGAAAGDYSCTVDFLVNGSQVMAGDAPDPAFQQIINVSVGGSTAKAEATSYNGANAVADFIYQCPGTAKYPVATSVKGTVVSTDPTTGVSDLTFAALIDASVVPGGNCTLTTLVSDLFERSSPADQDATSTVLTVTKAPVVEIYTPGDGKLFTTKAKIFATGWGTDPDGGPLTFSWTLSGPLPSTTVVASATGPNAIFGPLSTTGDYAVSFSGTDTESKIGTAARTITIVAESSPLLPQQYSFNGFFSPAKNWPDTNQVNAGQAFTAKWTFRDNSGQEVTTDGIFGAQLQQVVCSTRAAIGPPVFSWQVGATMIRYDAKGQQWIGNINIPAGVGNCYTWTLELKDGSLHSLFLQAVK